MAGTETTSNTLVFAAYHLIKNPQVQKKIHAELDREMGTDEIPTMEHRNRFVTRAFSFTLMIFYKIRLGLSAFMGFYFS